MKIDVKKLKLKVYADKGYIHVKGSSHKVNIPNLDEDMALFLGMLWGDGWIVNRSAAKTKGQWRIGIVEDDRSLIRYFIYLTEKIFSIKPKINDRKTKLEAYFNSRIVYEILNRTYAFPDGEKIDKLRIPKDIIKSKKLSMAFLKGLFSTDGKFTIYKQYPRVGLDSATLSLIKDVEKVLSKNNFNPRVYTWNRKDGNKLYGLYLNGLNQVNLFHWNIGFVGEKANKLQTFINQ